MNRTHPLAPCFVQTFEDMQLVLGTYTLAVIGIDPYYSYDAIPAQQEANQKQWLNSVGLRNADDILDLPDIVQEPED